MTNGLLAELQARRKQIERELQEIERELQARIDEVDRMIDLATPASPPSPRRRRTKAFSVTEIIDPEVLHALLATQVLTSQQMSRLLPGKKLGPMVSAWKRRAKSADVVYDELVERVETPDGDYALSLTDEGRRLFGAAVNGS